MDVSPSFCSIGRRSTLGTRMIFSFLRTFRLVDVERGRMNNVNLLRLMLASSVILSHAYPITGQMDREPMARFSHSGASLGDVAVIGFFFLSGYLIFKSALRHPDPGVFLRARALRIFPALAAAVMLSAFAVGGLFTQWPRSAYFSDSRTYRYLLNIVLNHNAGITLPGLFQHNAIHEANLPLWTLSSEWSLYMLALLVCMAVHWRTVVRELGWRSWLIFFAAALLSAQMLPLPWKYTWRWALAFLLGAAIYLLRKWVVLSLPVAIAFLCLDLALIRFVPHAGKLLFPFGLCYLLLVFSFDPRVCFRWFLALGDFSYGCYIYGWPVEQVVSFHLHAPLPLFMVSMGLTLPLAALSWFLVESPSLSFKRSSFPAIARSEAT